MKFILVYKDHFTKFVLQSLCSKKKKKIDEEIDDHLDIFVTFGAPNILHSNSRREFWNQIINSLCEMCIDIKIFNSKPRCSQSQSSVKQVNQDIENVLATWMETNMTGRIKICSNNEKQSISQGNQIFTLCNYVWLSYEAGTCKKLNTASGILNVYCLKIFVILLLNCIWLKCEGNDA
ncbi:KRAB-A domain-containing protein 2, partial [Stegodyphus mimosarum]